VFHEERSSKVAKKYHHTCLSIDLAAMPAFGGDVWEFCDEMHREDHRANKNVNNLNAKFHVFVL
jgi:hypothetical protein